MLAIGYHFFLLFRITLGNQLDGTYLVDPEVVERYRKRYPNGTDSKGNGS